MGDDFIDNWIDDDFGYLGDRDDDFDYGESLYARRERQRRDIDSEFGDETENWYQKWSDGLLEDDASSTTAMYWNTTNQRTSRKVEHNHRIPSTNSESQLQTHTVNSLSRRLNFNVAEIRHVISEHQDELGFELPSRNNETFVIDVRQYERIQTLAIQFGRSNPVVTVARVPNPLPASTTSSKIQFLLIVTLIVVTTGFLFVKISEFLEGMGS